MLSSLCTAENVADSSTFTCLFYPLRVYIRMVLSFSGILKFNFTNIRLVHYRFFTGNAKVKLRIFNEYNIHVQFNFLTKNYGKGKGDFI